MSFYFCAHLKDVEQGPDFQLTKWLYRNKFVAKRLEADQRAKYLNQARGCKEFWSWAALVWIRGSEGDSGRKGSQQVLGVAQAPIRAGTAHLPSAFAWFSTSQLTLGIVSQQMQPGLCSGVSQLGLLLPFLGSGEQGWAAGGHDMQEARITFSHCLRHFATRMTWNRLAASNSLNNGDHCSIKYCTI